MDSRIVKTVAAALAFTGISGCGLMHPYPEPLVQRPDVYWRAESAQARSDHLVTTDEAIMYARSVEDAYRTQVRRLSATRTAANTTMIALATGALAVVASGGSSDLATGLGLGGGAIAATSRQVAVGVYRSLYFQGAASIECSIGAVERARSAPTILRATVLGWQNAVHADVGLLQTLVDKARNTRPATDYSGDAIALATIVDEGLAALAVASQRLAFAEEALTSSDRLGRILVTRVEAIRIRVDNEIAKAEPDLLAFDKSLKESLDSSGGLFKKEEPAKTPAPASGTGVKNRGTFPDISPTVADLVRRIDDAVHNLEDSGLQLVASASKLTADSIPADLFAACSDGPGNGALKVTPATASVAPSKLFSKAVLVSQGTGPYTARNDFSSGISVDDGSAVGGGWIYAVTLDANSAKSGSRHVVLWKDSAGAEASFVIEVQGTGTAAARSSAPSARSSSRESSSDSNLAQVQQFLKDESESSDEPAFDPKGVDGEWGQDTADALVAYLEANYEGSEPAPDFAHMGRRELLERVRREMGN